MERLIDNELRQIIDGNLLSKQQHRYNKGRSADTALINLTRITEESLAGNTPLAASLDIGGTFNNVGAISGALTRLQDTGYPGYCAREQSVRRWDAGLLPAKWEGELHRQGYFLLSYETL